MKAEPPATPAPPKPQHPSTNNEARNRARFIASLYGEEID